MSAYKELSSLTRKWKKHNSTIGIINQIDNDCQFGVEIECFRSCKCEVCGSRMSYSSCTKCHHRNTVQVQLPEDWIAWYDGSVKGDGFEIISPILRGKKGLLELKTVLTKLRRNGYGVSAGCGGHTNVSIRNKYIDFYSVESLWISKYRSIFLNCPGARDKGHYCYGDIGEGNWNKRDKVVCKDDYYEFRLWAGTLDYRQWAAQIGLGYAFLKESLGDS